MAAPTTTPLLTVSHLDVSYPSRHGAVSAVRDISLSLDPGEILGIVGESGAGKSTIGHAIAGLLTPPGELSGGEVILRGKELRSLSEEEMRQVRGKDIGFVFQDPMTSLNPLLTIEDQLTEPMLLHLGMSREEAHRRAVALLDAVGIAEPELRLSQFPHQFSGGMRQRVVIAVALATDPVLIIADEPTTALDVSIQDQILQLLQKLCRAQQVGCMLITHDMGVIAAISDRVMVTYRGRLVEIGATRQVLSRPEHPYTQSLISAVPPAERKLHRFPRLSYSEDAQSSPAPDLSTHFLGHREQEPNQTDSDHDILQVDDLCLRFLTRSSLFAAKRRYLQALDRVSFTIQRGESFGLVGESGSGKSTVARCLTGLYRPERGKIMFEGQELTALASEKARLPYRRQMQMVFQNPYSSLNPRMRVADIIAEPMRVHRLVESTAARRQVVADLLTVVGLGADAGKKYPHQFSGGQRQRISIARALALRPRLLICDEPTSALDVSVQAQILNLLKDLQEQLKLSILFISHDLPVVRQMCARIAVMRSGRLVEVATSDQIFDCPEHPYTRKLIALMPRFNRSAA